MKKTFFQLAAFLFVLLVSLECRTYVPSVTRQNVATQYRAEEKDKMLRPKYVVYNVTDSLSRIYFTINSSELLYSRNQNDAGYSAHMLILYVVRPIDYAKVVTDSGHVTLTDAGTPGESKQLASAVDFDVYENGKYFLEVTFRDLNRMSASYELLYLDHRKNNARNNFLVTQADNGTPLFRNHVDSAEQFRIQYYRSDVRKLFVHYYRNISGPAPPPYAPDRKPANQPADSTWQVDISASNVMQLGREGWYRFTIDSSSTDGLVVTRFHDDFPKISLARQMVYPLRYLTMKDEYNTMDSARNIKKAVDNFWLSKSGSQERAREVIRYFYNRVEAANNLFTTNIEGWKTDRGMVYLVFGPPENVYKVPAYETWIYTNDLAPGGLTFVFDHKDNGNSDQEFVLERNTDFRANWITAVDSWRQGHVYTLH